MILIKGYISLAWLFLFFFTISFTYGADEESNETDYDAGNLDYEDFIDYAFNITTNEDLIDDAFDTTTNEDLIDSELDTTSNESKTEEKEENSEITIAEHLREDPGILESFRPSALRNVVSNPKSLAILPMKVLDKIINDPIFSVQLPDEALQKISELFMERLSMNETVDETSEEFDYDYYDLEMIDDTVNSFVGDLSPEFLQSIDPDIIVEYFNNASPEDLKAILTNSSILLSLPTATVGSLLGKLNQDLLVKLLQSEAVAELYDDTTNNFNEEQQERLVDWQIDVAEHIINNVANEVLIQLPEDIVKTQLNNTRALSALLNHPDKLEALFNRYMSILDNLNPDTILDLTRRQPNALQKIPSEIFNKFASCSVVRSLSEEFNANQLISNHTDRFVNLVTDNPEIINCISDIHLKDFVKKTFDDALFLDMNQMCMITQNMECKSQRSELSNSLFNLKKSSMLRLAERTDILKVLPDMFIIDMVNSQQHLLMDLKKNSLVYLAKEKPFLVGRFSMDSINMLVKREDVLSELTNSDVVALLEYQPKLLTALSTIPTDKFVMFMAVHIDILDNFPPTSVPGLKRILQNTEILRAIPTELHAKMAVKSVIQQVMDKFTLLDILETHPYVPTRLTPEELQPYLKFLYSDWFRDRLPCPTIRIAVNEASFLNSLPTDLLTKVITSRHLLSCIENEDLEGVMSTADLGSRLPFSTLMITARNLRLSQISFRLAVNLVNQVTRSTPRLFFN